MDRNRKEKHAAHLPFTHAAAAPQSASGRGAAAVCANGSGRRALLFILRFSDIPPLKVRIFTLLFLLILSLIHI